LLVVGVASDGLEAILKTERLQPNLILLDIGLPRLDGIEAARRILSAAPESKILFLSQESDLDVARAALSAGGHGYVVKSDADDDLIGAIETVMEGERYLSRKLAGPAFGNVGGLPAARRLRREEHIAAAPSLRGEIGHRHSVQFYGDDASFVNGFTPSSEPL
jgi:DNA-binding NarL/FixJ family response regulator